MSDTLCYLHPRKVRAVFAGIFFGGFFLWIIFGNYAHLPPHDGLHSVAQRSAPGGRWRPHGAGTRRLLSVNESGSGNCSTVHLVTSEGVKIDLDNDAVSGELARPVCVVVFVCEYIHCT